MEREFCSYEQALTLKELGFGAIPIGGFQQESVFYFENGKLYYDYLPMYSSSSHEGQLIAPLKQQVFRWFREKYGLVGFVFNSGDNKYSFNISDNYFLNTTYEEAENACIDKLIEIVKQQAIS